MEKTLTYYDQRFGDIYHIRVLGHKFLFALRYVERVGSDPITYDRIDELPDEAQNEIEQLVLTYK